MADTSRRTELLRHLPSVDAVTGNPGVADAADGVKPSIVTALARECIERTRQSILSGDVRDDPASRVVAEIRRELEALSGARLSEVINATGVIIHTNLGRAPVSQETSQAMSLAAGRYTPLELQLSSGKRGGRMSEISQRLRLLTRADDSLVVNNNAAAVLLVLSALCSDREVILSRSQAVEIGGGFRIPDVMAQSGARLVEVGTTNRTYARDYDDAISQETAALLTVHWSNFRIVGFTSQPSLAELSELARSRDVILIEDLGSGSLLDTGPYGLTPEPTVTQSIEAGVDVVCFSGDKLFGGPQAGIISGRRDLIQRISRHPLARAVRADKTALAGISATLTHYTRGEAVQKIPVWKMISMDRERLRDRCEWYLSELGYPDGVEIVETSSAIGGGALPGDLIPSWGLAISTSRPDDLARQLRTGTPAIMPHIDDNRLILDARTVLPEQDEALVRGIQGALWSG